MLRSQARNLRRGISLAAAAAALLCLDPALRAQTEGKFIQVELEHTIKAKKAKTGDAVEAKTVASVTLPDGTKISRGHTVYGTITAVDANSVAIAFHEIEMDGKRTPMALSIRGAMLPGGDSGKPGEVVPAGTVIGMKGVTLDLDDSPAHASKFTSQGKELQLRAGLQLMLQPVQPPAQ